MCQQKMIVNIKKEKLHVRNEGNCVEKGKEEKIRGRRVGVQFAVVERAPFWQEAAWRRQELPRGNSREIGAHNLADNPAELSFLSSYPKHLYEG